VYGGPREVGLGFRVGGRREGEISGDTEGSGREQFLMGFHAAMGVIKRDEMRVRTLIVTKTIAN
jgi:hypothetical protein